MSEKIIRKTASVCPVCLKRVVAYQVENTQDHRVWQIKKCEEHGNFRNLIWAGRMPIADWRGNYPTIKVDDAPLCPTNCGLCSDHLQKTCCVILEVTNRCNLKCKFCFAQGGDKAEAEPTFEELKKQIHNLVDGGRTLIQISGGEPTMREDLPELIAEAKKAGCKYVQLNSNGIRIANEKGYIKKLKDAGLSFVFMQFDGVTDDVYRTLRGRNLFLTKCRAIANCAKENIGVTLVPTVTPGVNDKQLGDILRFAVKHSPAVRGIHLQPAGYLGRIPDIPEEDARYPLDRLLFDLVEQSDGMLKLENLAPSCCDHPLCSFHGDFMVLPKGKLMPLGKKYTGKTQNCCCCGSEDDAKSAEKNREFVGKRWLRGDEKPEEDKDDCCCDDKAMDMDYFVKRVKTHGFTITSMTFQDAGTFDLERLRRCSLHIYKDGKFIPFCANYLTPWN